jgi:hypothetical protein
MAAPAFCRVFRPLRIKVLRFAFESTRQAAESICEPPTMHAEFGSPTLAEPKALDQFLVLSTSALALIQGIMSRSFAPTSSIGWAA